MRDANPGVELEIVTVPAEFVRGLKCRVCGRSYPKEPLHFCPDDFGPLEPDYDREAQRRSLTRDAVNARPRSLWRYRELLPLDGEPLVGRDAGWTPLVRAERLARELNIREIWIKDETASPPTASYKDRVVAVAVSKAREFGFDTVACASTGSLAHALAVAAQVAGMRAVIFVPAHAATERIRGARAAGAHVIAINGSYDDVHRLCNQILERRRWAFVNVNLWPFYVEGSKTVGLEIAEQLGWRLPQHTVVPMAGGGLLVQTRRVFEELALLGLIDDPACRIHGVQAAGCNPITAALKAGRDAPRPVRKPETVCTSLAVGDPGDGVFALEAIRTSGGWAEDATDDELRVGVDLLERTTGLRAEPAGGVVVATARKLIEQGRIGRDEEVVLVVTGGRPSIVEPSGEPLSVIGPSLAEFEALGLP